MAIGMTRISLMAIFAVALAVSLSVSGGSALAQGTGKKGCYFGECPDPTRHGTAVNAQVASA